MRHADIISAYMVFSLRLSRNFRVRCVDALDLDCVIRDWWPVARPASLFVNRRLSAMIELAKG